CLATTNIMKLLIVSIGVAVLLASAQAAPEATTISSSTIGGGGYDYSSGGITGGSGRIYDPSGVGVTSHSSFTLGAPRSGYVGSVGSGYNGGFGHGSFDGFGHRSVSGFG
ncbi:hypothetical protein OTU49_008730, partial [Cherax quadricarinatus]